MLLLNTTTGERERKGSTISMQRHTHAEQARDSDSKSTLTLSTRAGSLKMVGGRHSKIAVSPCKSMALTARKKKTINLTHVRRLASRRGRHAKVVGRGLGHRGRGALPHIPARGIPHMWRHIFSWKMTGMKMNLEQ
jgi:hypothetical protein